MTLRVRGHSRSLTLVPLKSLGTVSYSPSIVTMAVFAVAVCEIFSRACVSLNQYSTETMSVYRTVSETFSVKNGVTLKPG